VTHELRAYWQLAMVWPQIAYAYRFNILFWMLETVMRIYILGVVWTTVYREQGGVAGLALDDLITYLTLANLQLMVTYPIVGEMIQTRVREGLIAIDLARPVPLLGQLVSQQIGATLGLMPPLLLVLPLAFLLGSLRLPSSPEAALLYLASTALAYAILVEIALLLGLLAFWTVETWAFNGIYQFVNQFFAGALVPLILFPDWLRLVANMLPFQTQAHVPLSIYVGQLTGAAALQGLLLQAFWVVALAALAQLLWKRAEQKIVVQGG
jgi:ABC-2 type transport system permease protein